MNYILQLQQDRETAVKAARAISETAKGRAWTAEEQAAFDGLEATANGLTATLDREQRMGNLSNIHTDRRGATEVHNNAEDAPFESLGEFLLCVRAVPTTGKIDARLHKRAALGANETVGSDGAFLVGKDVAPDILQELHDVGMIAPLCKEIPISNNSNGITMNGVDETSRANGSRWGGVQAYWTNEAQAMTASRPKFRPISLKLEKLTALFYATDEELADAAALGSIAQTAFAEEMAFKLDDAIIGGVGGGQPLGVLNAGGKVKINKESGQAAATFVYENAVNMYARCLARSRSKASWYINQELERQLPLMNLSVGTGGAAVFIPAGGAAALPYSTLFGRPIVTIEQCSALGTEGDVILADWSQYLLATKGGMQQAQSIHVAFLTNETAFRFVYRADGQPLRASPLTPFKGASTLSSFVTLETRS